MSGSPKTLALGIFLLTSLAGYQNVAAQGSIPSTPGWFLIPSNHIRDVCPPDFFNGYSEEFHTRCKNVINYSSGGTVDTFRNRLIIWGGGHRGYRGNELYALDLNSLTFLRLTNPSPPVTLLSDGSDCVNTLADGNPNARSTHDGLAYIEHADKLFAFSGEMACGQGWESWATWTFDFTTLAWQNMRPVGAVPQGRAGVVSAYDPNTRKVLLHNGRALYAYSLETNSYQQLSPGEHIDYRMTAELDPVRKKFVIVGGRPDRDGGVKVFDIGPRSRYTIEDWPTTGAEDIMTTGATPGVAYDPVTDRIVAWAGGDTVYSLDMGTRVWTPVTFSGGPGPAAAEGTFGRWGYVPNLGVFVVVNGVDSDAFTLRFTTTPPIDTIPPSLALTAPASGALVSGAVLVSASASDNVGVAGVRFEVDGANLPSEALAPPYSVTWDTKHFSDGSHTLRAIASDGAGNIAASSAITVTVDNTAPALTAMTAGGITSTQASISWTTTEPADTQVEYGPTASYGSTSLITGLRVSHSVTLTGLSSSTLYHFRIKSRDAAGNPAVSEDQTFSTLAPPTLTIAAPVANSLVPGGTVEVIYTKSGDLAGVEHVHLKLDGNSEVWDPDSDDAYQFTNIPAGPHTLRGYLAAADHTKVPGTDIIVNFTIPDTTPPAISAITGTNVTANRATITWTTDEPGDTQVEYGPTTDYGITTKLEHALVLRHGVTLAGLSANTTYNYRVRSRDTAGNLTSSANLLFTTVDVSGSSLPPTLGWFFLPTAHLRDVCPPDFFNGYGEEYRARCHNVMKYSGGTVDLLRNRLIMWGGGHRDYLGNELYSLDLNTQSFARLTDPSPPVTLVSDGSDCVNTLADGNPNSRHTYDGLAYIEHADKLFTFSGSLACGGGYAHQDTWTFDFQTLAWQKMPATGAIPEARQGIVSAYDPNTGKVFLHNGKALYAYSLETNSYEKLSPGESIDYRMTAEIDPVRKTFVIVGTGGVKVFDIGSGSSYTIRNWVTVGGDAIVNSASPGLAYDPVIDRIVAWPGGDTVYSLDLDTRVWTPVTFAGGPGPAAEEGTFGRWGYLPNLGVFVLVNDADNAFALRFPAVAPIDTTPPTVAFTTLTSGTAVSGTVTLSATASDDVRVMGVQFKLDGVNIGAEVTRSPYSLVWDTTTATNGGHILTAAARDPQGNVTTSSDIMVTVDNSAPSVSIMTPLDGAEVSGSSVAISATASDNIGVGGVQFTLDGANLGAQVTTPPYALAWDATSVTNGAHSLSAVTRDAAGNQAIATAISVTVSNATPDNTPPTVELTAPTSGATLSGILNISASASDDVGVAGVQFALDGANLGAAVTTAPFSLSWDTTTATNGPHTLSAVARDAAGNQTSSALVGVTIANNSSPSITAITIFERSGAPQVNRPVSIAQVFRQGDIRDFVQASIDGALVLTQTDVKNRWPDGSLKFAVVSFVVPSLPANGSVTVSFSNQLSGNNTGFLTQADMLSGGYDFDGTIVMAGANTQTVSAREMLTNGHFRYWLRGPIVTAIILEDRATAKTYDKDFGDGSQALHPIFEAWFYPAHGSVELGYTVENTWASSDPQKGMRDLAYSLTLKAGATAQATKFTQSTFNHIGRTRWHKKYWVGTDPGALRVDHNLKYLVTTRAIPNYDTGIKIDPSLADSTHGQWANADKTLGGGATGVGNYDKNMNAGGANPWIGLMNTWDTIYLLTMDDRLREMVLGNADLAGRIPMHYREADVQAGTGRFFDRPDTGSVETFGRTISVNARKTVSLRDITYTCGSRYAADGIRTGQVGDDGWGEIARSHMPDVAYLPYLLTGRYYYLEELQYWASYNVAQRSGCYGEAWERQGESGYLNDSQVRGDAWGFRTVAYGAFISPDGTPEKIYYEDKLGNNIAKWEGGRGLPLSDLSKQAHWDWGNANDRVTSPLGAWRNMGQGFVESPLKTDGSVSGGASQWEEYFLITAFGMAKQFGYPTDGLLKYMARQPFNILLNPALVPYLIEAYHYPTISGATGNWVQTWPELLNGYESVATGWKTGAGRDSTDHGYGFIALAALSYLYDQSVDGWTGKQTWDFLSAKKPEQRNFATLSPKWAILPLATTAPPPTPSTDATPPTVAITAPTRDALVSGSAVNLSAAASDNVGVVGVQFAIGGANVGPEGATDNHSILWDTRTVSDGPHTITAVARDAAGNTTTSAAVSVAVDNTASALSAITSAGVTSIQASITWTTTEPTDAQVDYGQTTGYGSTTALLPGLGTSHSVTLTGLSPSTLYHFRVQSRDAAGNLAISEDQTFTTPAPPTLTIVAPVANSQVKGSTVEVSYTKSGDLTGVDHVHLKLDGEPEVRDVDFDGAYQFTNVPAGPHTLTGYLAGADHVMLPGTAISVTFTIPDAPL